MGQGMTVESQTFFTGKFLQEYLKTLPEGSVSQHFDLGFRIFFMLCRNF